MGFHSESVPSAIGPSPPRHQSETRKQQKIQAVPGRIQGSVNAIGDRLMRMGDIEKHRRFTASKRVNPRGDGVF